MICYLRESSFIFSLNRIFSRPDSLYFSGSPSQEFPGPSLSWPSVSKVEYMKFLCLVYAFCTGTQYMQNSNNSALKFPEISTVIKVLSNLPSSVVGQMFSHLPMRNLRAFLRTNRHYLILELGRLYIPCRPHIPEEKLEAQKSWGTCLRPQGQSLARALGNWTPFLCPILTQKLDYCIALPLCCATNEEKEKANNTGLLGARNLHRNRVNTLFCFSV